MQQLRLSALALIAIAAVAQAPPAPSIYTSTTAERQHVEQKVAELEAALRPLRGHVSDDLLVDVDVYLKAGQWILRFNEFYSKAYVDQALTVLETGVDRARQIAANNPAWTKRTGCFSRAYRSRVDGSVQPYALTIPENYKASNPEWLEVILHGRGATLNEVSFLYAHDRAKPAAADHEFIQLDVFGRGNNAYRWAGETDVFEAIESVQKRYKIDPDRIVVRGFSMGGAGAWHIGLHYPDRWAAVEAGAGFVETKVHGEVPNPPPYAHIYDALDYAANAFNVPIVGYGGEDDPQLRASVFVRQELTRLGYRFEQDGLNYKSDDAHNDDLRALFLVGPKTQHRWHPDSNKLSDAFVLHNQSGGILEKSQLHFVTYTERYNRCFGVTVDQLEKQYERAQVDAEQHEFEYRVKTRNVSRITLRGEPPTNTFRVDGQAFPMKQSATFAKVNGKWNPLRGAAGLQKSHGLQGPIDDAFMESFLCVRPGAKASASAVNEFAMHQLDQFAQEFPKWMRGDVPMKSDREVTPADVRGANIVAFGTASTNPLIARALEGAPIHWTAEAITIGDRKFDAQTHMLSMIYPNPSNPHRYFVINSGHTIHEADFKGTNALLYPRVGDWAITDVRTGAVVAEGVFDRQWR